MEEKISIVIPIYNVEPYLKECIDNILNQTFQDFEVLLINDGSKDNSGIICDQYAKIDSRINVIHKSNSGVSDARNLGIELAKGQYIVFVDSDDTVESEYLETLYREITEGDFDCVVCGYRIIRAKSHRNVCVREKVIIDDIQNCEEKFASLYKQKLLNSPWNKIYKSKSIKSSFDSSLAMGEDLVFNLHFIKGSKKIKIIPDVLYNYIQHSNSAVATYKTSRMRDIIKVNNILMNFCSSTFSNVEYIIDIQDSCVNEIDGLLRHLFRGKNKPKERKEIIRVWCGCEEYVEFCQKFVSKNSILLKNSSEIYKYYNLKTWLERIIVRFIYH